MEPYQTALKSNLVWLHTVCRKDIHIYLSSLEFKLVKSNDLNVKEEVVIGNGFPIFSLITEQIGDGQGNCKFHTVKIRKSKANKKLRTT